MREVFPKDLLNPKIFALLYLLLYLYSFVYMRSRLWNYSSS